MLQGVIRHIRLLSTVYRLYFCSHPLYSVPMPHVACRLCKKEFYTKPNWLKLGYGKYCSRVCSSLSRRKGKQITCAICSKEVYKSLKSIKGSQSGKLFCSKKCSLIWHNSYFIQEKSGNWKTGEFSYKRHVLRSGVKAFCRLCEKNDKRILLVHHLDKNRENNRLNNLTWLCHNCHFLVHHYQERENILYTIHKKEYA